MKISSRGRYAVRIMSDIALAKDKFVSTAEIAKNQNISVKYLEQIISKLLKNKLVVSSHGAQGGYRLAKEPKDYKISEILAVTGDLPELSPCQSGALDCPIRNKCSSISMWDNLSKLIFDYLESITLEDLINKK